MVHHSSIGQLSLNTRLGTCSPGLLSRPSFVLYLIEALFSAVGGTTVTHGRKAGVLNHIDPPNPTAISPRPGTCSPA